MLGRAKPGLRNSPPLCGFEFTAHWRRGPEGPYAVSQTDTPASATAGRGVFFGAASGQTRAGPDTAYFRCQISLLYWAMVRSLEKNPLRAVFTSIFRAQKGLSP